MLFWLLYRMTGAEDLLAANAAWTKITFRASLAAAGSFAIAVLLGPRLIRWLRARYREPIVCDSKQIEQLHRHKDATPTMGGLFIMIGILAAAVLFCDLANPYVLTSVILLSILTLLGIYDDHAKIVTRRGVRAWTKLSVQSSAALLVAVLIYSAHSRAPDSLVTAIPVVGVRFDLGLWFVPLATIVIVGASNAVNLTDGLDGLAGGCYLFAVAGMGAVVYVAGHAGLAGYLGVKSISGAGELTVVVGAAIGAVLGFLWFNCHPAQVFMGDTGSLPLGGLLGLLAVVSRQELLLLVVAGVFVVEAASVILQVGHYKWRRRRIFRCAPLHHHFQLLGWSESKIVVRFWIVSALCAIAGLACLKGNFDDSGTTTATPVTVAGDLEKP